LFFLLLTLLMTWPLAVILPHGVLGTPGDNLEYCYKLSWFKHAFFDPDASPFFNPDVFYPVGYPLALHEMSLTNVCLGMPLLLSGTATTVYNLLVIVSFVLSGFGAYLIVLKVTRRADAGLLAGVLFAFCSYRMAHLGAGHLNLLGTQWIPLLLLSVEGLVGSRIPRTTVLVGTFFALSALSSWYYALMLAVCVGAYILVRVRCSGVSWDRRLIFLLAGSALVALLVMVPSIVATVEQWGGGAMHFSLGEVDRYSASLSDWLLPNAFSPLWGRGVAPQLDGYRDVPEYLVGLSWVGLLLTALALREKRDGVRKAYVALLVLAVLMGLGTTLHQGGDRWYVGVPSWVERAFTAVVGVLANRLALNPSPSYYELRSVDSIYLPLPAFLAYLFVPFFSALRVWTRFGLIAALSVAVLAGLGLAGVRRRLRVGLSERAWLLSALVITLAVVELWSAPYSLGWTEVGPQPVDQWLAQQEGDGAVAVFPLWKAESGPGLYASWVHEKPVAYGYGGFFPQWYRDQRPILWGFPSEQSIGLLRDCGVRYVLVGSESYGSRWPEVRESLGSFPVLREVKVLDEEPRYHGGWMAEMLRDFGQAFIVDRIHVYELT
jgi:hypothetical protein